MHEARARRLDELAERRAGQGSLFQDVRTPMFKAIAEAASDSERRAATRAQERLISSWAKQAARRPEAPNAHSHLRSSTRFGSFVHRYAAPYDFSWTPTWTRGSPEKEVEASQKSGGLLTSAHTDDHNASGADLWAGVGVYWSIPSWLDQETGTLRLTVNASYADTWACAVWFDNARATGELVLNLDCFDSAGAWQSLPIHQTYGLFDDGGDPTGSTGEDSSNGVTITAETQVDHSHFYNAWLFAHVNVYGDGFHNFLGVPTNWGVARGHVAAVLQSLTAEFG
jgi:hypothetical protein